MKPKSLDSVTEISPRWNNASFPRKLIRLLGIGNVSRFLPIGLRLCDWSLLLVVVIYMKRLPKFAHYLTGRLRCTPCRKTPALKSPFPLSVSSTEEQISLNCFCQFKELFFCANHCSRHLNTKRKKMTFESTDCTPQRSTSSARKEMHARSLGSLYKNQIIHDKIF